MRLSRFSTLLSLLLLSACVPAIQSTRSTLDTASLDRDWTSEYKAALEGVDKHLSDSCASFRHLSEPGSSPISPLAQARAFQYCSAGKEAAAIAGLRALDGKAGLSWLKPLIAQAVVELAQHAKLGEPLADYALARSRDLGSQREKENLLQAALAAANAQHLTAQAQALQAELYRISPRLDPKLPASLWLKAADDFRTNSDWPRALTFYRRILKQGQGGTLEHFKALDGIRQVQKTKFRNEGGSLQDFLNASRALATWCESTLSSGRSLTQEETAALLPGWLQFVRDNWSYGNLNLAKQEIQRALGLRWPTPLFRAYAFWLQGRIHANYSEWAEAAASTLSSTELLGSEARHSGSWGKWQWQLWDDSFWAAALAQRKLHNWEKSAALLSQALAQTLNATNKLKFTFWLAENLKDGGQGAQAHDAFQRLAELDPHDFYGFLAMYELGTPLTPLPDLNLDEVHRPASVAQNDFDSLIWLAHSGEQALAQKYSHALLPAKSVRLDEILLRAYVKDFSRIWELSYLIDPAQKNAWMARYARLVYPQPYLELVQSAASHFSQVDKEYVYAIMRQESGFDTLSLSPAYAYGLLQLIPSAARAMESKAGVRFEHNDELFEPAINIPLGVALMDTLVNQTRGSFILRTGAYNAALDKVLEWRDKLYKGNSFEFLEEIPYDETRAYVRLVMRNYLMNLRLNARQPFAFPAELLKP